MKIKEMTGALSNRIKALINDLNIVDKHQTKLLNSVSLQEGPLSQKQEQTIVKVLKNILLNFQKKEDTINFCRLFDSYLVGLVQSIIDDLEQGHLQVSHSIDIVFSIILQYTSKLNLTILSYYAKHNPTYCPFQYQQINIGSLLETIYRLFEAQPYLIQVWNCAPIFNITSQHIQGTNSDFLEFLLVQIKEIIHPTKKGSDYLESIKTLEKLAYVDQLRLSKQEEREKQVYINQTLGDLEIEDEIRSDLKQEQEQDDKIMTEYLKGKVTAVNQKMEQNIFNHFVIFGDDGSGKMSFVQLLSETFNYHKNQSNQFIVVTLEETFDSKNLVGTYVCNESGEFVFKKGPLAVAAELGLWLILRNIEKAPADLLSFLLPLVQSNTLQVTSTFTITPKLGFRIFALCHSTQPTEDIKPFLSLLHPTVLEKLDERNDFQTIVELKYPYTFASRWLSLLLIDSVQYLAQRLNHFKSYMLDHKQFSVRQLFKLYGRVESLLKRNFNKDDLKKEGTFMSSSLKQQMLEEISDIYLGYLYDKDVKSKLITECIQNVWNKQSEHQLDPNMSSDHIIQSSREYGINKESCFFGRAQQMLRVKRDEDEVEQQQSEDESKRFAYTATTLRLMEQLSQGISQEEALLLVGETGTGKTTTVQELAKLLGKKLHVFNMNSNTDSSDLLGGFKPVDLKFLLRPIYQHFLYVFKRIFPSNKNQKFLDLSQKCYEENRVKDFIQCMTHGLQSITSKEKVSEDVSKLELMITDLKKRSQKLESGGGFIFQFIEGTLIQSIKNGDWILLDEINLASESVLNRIATLVDGNYILLNERADIVETKRHSDFRMFLCMNPPYTSAGKKQLPWSLRSKLTELYVPELDSQTDLWMIIDRYAGTTINEGHKRKILEFYVQVRHEVYKITKRGNIGLRNLSRSLSMMKQAIKLQYPIVKAIFDSLYACFASHLELQMQLFVSGLILQIFDIRTMPELSIVSDLNADRYTYVEGFVIPKSKFQPQNFDSKDFITTKSFQRLLKQLASIVAVTDYAVILQGPTSAGKTSTVQYLANVTHNKIIRINNHMHTDIQEYLGSYVPDNTGGGKLIFQEGVLVEAVRNGYWVILDELNLAPSEVLEALNRLLDDNRELFIVETQKVVKAHPNFRIFATQNPTEGYGGRKELSEAFKNRFILIQVNEVPLNELEKILIEKCEMPQSRANQMVKIMERLQIYRSQGNIFSGKESTITVRDLLKWANRLRHSKSSSTRDLALEGYLVLGERARNEQDKLFIKQTIEEITKSKIDEYEYYEEYFAKYLSKDFLTVPQTLNLPKIIQSQQLKRLAVLVHKCLLSNEPVLLVGETGCGKTTLCQVFAAINKQILFSINCHQNTETSDFIGCMRTRKNLKQSQDKFAEGLLQLVEVLRVREILNQQQMEEIKNHKSNKKLLQTLLKITKQVQNIDDDVKKQLSALKELRDDLDCIFEWHDGILVESMQQGGLLLIDEISLANDSVLERLNSVFEADRTLVLSEKSSSEAIKILASQGFNMVATMNPSGDFGKKELSPALRNRMTEIWVESYFQQQELVTLYSQVSKQSSNYSTLTTIADSPLFKEISTKIDLYLIIAETASDKLNGALKPIQIEMIAKGIFNMIGFVNYVLTQQYFAMSRKSLSIRDILNMLEFIKVSLNLLNKDPVEAFKHAMELVIIDGLCLGIDVTGDKQKQEIHSTCNRYLNQIIEMIFNQSQFSFKEGQFINTISHIGVTPFLLSKDQNLSTQQSNYAFDAETTKTNLLKLLRAFQLNKPILIEGPPGVGKTSLVENLAKVSGKKLIRVNLSEQTDMMDLLGSEYPVSEHKDEGNQDGEDEEEIRFHWCDGVLLRAIKEGHWFLIDEMNLAQQSVLEGLNAILDHRRCVYIPELNTEFQCHPDFFVFACQNPSQSSSSVGGRKTMPKSFLNRFNKIYLEELNQRDYSCILHRQISNNQNLQHIDIEKLLELSKQVEALIKQDSFQYQDEGAINMRDLSRFLKLYESFIQEGNSHQNSIIHAFQICYLQRLSKLQLKAIKQLQISGLININSEEITLQSSQLVRINEDQSLTFKSLYKPTQLRQKLSSVVKGHCLKLEDYVLLKGQHSTQLQYIVDCINANISLLIVTNDMQKLVMNLESLSKLGGYSLNRLLLNEKSDTSQLLGCFEQTAQDITEFVQQLKQLKDDETMISDILQLEQSLKHHLDQAIQFKLCERFIHEHPQLDQHYGQKLRDLESIIKKGTSRFEWVDSVLIKAIEKGEWVIFENANLCNPSILDRLNPLLEEGNQCLSINEQGLIEGDQIREVNAHAGFRSIFLVSQSTLIDQGRDVSRALKNRCLQIEVSYNDEIDMGLMEINDSKLDQNMIDARYTQSQWDTQPIVQYDHNSSNNHIRENQSDEPMLDVNQKRLGKRNQRQQEEEDQQMQTTTLSVKQMLESSSSLLSTLKKANEDNNFSQSNKEPYAFYLVSNFNDSNILKQYMKTFLKQNRSVSSSLDASTHQQSDPWIKFLQYTLSNKNMKIQTQFQNSTSVILNKASKALLELITSQQQTQPFQTTNLNIIGEEVITLLESNKGSNLFSYLIIYLLTKTFDFSQISSIIQQSGEEDQLVEILMTHNLDLHIQKLQNVGPNPLQQNTMKEIKNIQSSLNDIKQSPIRLYVRDISSKEDNQKCIGMNALKHQYSVMLMDENKQFVKEESIDIYLIAEKINSPYMIMIPNTSSIVLISQSNLYQYLSLMKDSLNLKRLISKNEIFEKRQTILPPVYPFMEGKLEKYVIQKLYSANLNQLYNVENFESSFITAILDEESNICLRDIPAYYVCAQALQTQIKKHIQYQNMEQIDFKNMILEDPRISQEVKTQVRQLSLNSSDDSFINGLLQSKSALQTTNNIQANKAIDNIVDSIVVLNSTDILHVLESLFVLPYELIRLQRTKDIEQLHYDSALYYLIYQLRDRKEAQSQTQSIKEEVEKIQNVINQLETLKISNESQKQLRSLLLFIKDLIGKFFSLDSILNELCDKGKWESILEKLNILNRMIFKGFELYFVHFNHILSIFFASAITCINNMKEYIHLMRETEQQQILERLVLQFKGTDDNGLFLNENTLSLKKLASTEPKGVFLYEKHLKFLTMFSRLEKVDEKHKNEMTSMLIDYFVRRVVAKRLKEEQEIDDMEELVYKLPFKMKMQSLMELNKTYGDRTKEDIARMEREAQLEIEKNFPSYFDEFQRSLYGGIVSPAEGGIQKETDKEVKIDQLFKETLGIREVDQWYAHSFIKLRLKIVRDLANIYPRQTENQNVSWMQDATNHLREILKQSQSPSVMNISEVRLSKIYNFYHDELPHEARLVYDPLMKLLQRVKYILTEWESPILNDAMFLANYILTTFNLKKTPLMKLLTGLELILNKLDEWEIYASKSLNSCENEIILIKQLIIRYRKVQIMSWRNLLNWKKQQMIESDFENFVRLAHTLERQVFDTQLYNTVATTSKRIKENPLEIEYKVFELIDMFLRESSLGQFQIRLNFINLLQIHFKTKLKAFLKAGEYPLIQVEKMSERMVKRLRNILNIMHFIFSYYTQFKEKLTSTVSRLDQESRDKIKTLIDVSKWTVQKFVIVKNNIDKTHKQLNKACKKEQEVLMQNIQSLILTSSRKKYIQEEEQLMGLDVERKVVLDEQSNNEITIRQKGQPQEGILRQFGYLEKRLIQQRWPDSLLINETISDIFERIQLARITNKKHIQRRAFIDLLKYLKEEGLSHNFTQKLTSHLIESKLVSAEAFVGQQEQTKLEKYFYKSYELKLMMDSSSQVDEQSDLRNVDIIRIKSLSLALSEKILIINSSLSKIVTNFKNIKKIHHESKFLENDQSIDIVMNKEKCRLYQEIVHKLQIAFLNCKEKMVIQGTLDSDPLFSNLNISLESIPKVVYSEQALIELKSFMSTFQTLLRDLKIKAQASRSITIIDDSLNVLADIERQCFTLEEDSVEIDQSMKADQQGLKKKVQLLQKYIQLFYQDMLKILEEKTLALRKGSHTETTISDDHTNHSQQNNEVDESTNDLTIKEQVEFIDNLNEKCFDAHLPQIEELSLKIFTLRDIETRLNEEDRQQIQLSAKLIEKVVNLSEFVINHQFTYLKSLCKLSYVTQRIFLYLIFQGFCGKDDQDQDEKDKEQEEDDKLFESGGCGMGDGEGGQENVSNQIEHEEQVEGLKNYESEEEKEKEDKKDEKEEEGEDNDFEMKEGDFEGELEDKPQDEKDEEEKKEEEDNDDDELDKVDDMLDNQLWNQNMEDLEKLEEEDEKKKEEKKKEEVDLGDRDLDKQNQIENQEKEQIAGDHDKQEKEKGEESKEKEQKEGEEVEDNEEEGENEIGGDEEEKEEIPLDRDDVIEEDMKSEEGKDENMEDVKSETDDEKLEDDLEDKEEGKEDEEMDEGFEDKQNDKELPDNEEDANQEEQKEEEHKKDFNKDILENDQVQAIENQDQSNEQANLKQKKGQDNNLNKQQQNKQDQSKTSEVDEQTQFDVEGSDILYQLAKQLQQKEQQPKKQDTSQKKQQQEDPSKKSVENPKMNEEEKKQQQKQQQQQQDTNQDDAAMEYEFDEEADQVQGKLATDKVEEQKLKIQKEDDKENDQQQNMDLDQDEDKMKDDDENVNLTQQEVKNSAVQPLESNVEEQENLKRETVEMKEMESLHESLPDLIQDYQEYLELKKLAKLDLEEEKHDNDEMIVANTFDYDLDRFDYQQSKQMIRELFQKWSQDSDIRYQSQQLLNRFKQQTQQTSASLCEQLRIVLEPQLSQQLQGDYKTGKRLNMKKVISFIASHYRNDKIWLRRTMPSKRDYKILIAIDDSLSMKEKNLGFFSLEALVTITEALNKLEVGKVAVAGIRERLDLFQSFEDGYSNERTSFIMSQFNFNYCESKSADYSMANFVKDTNQLLDMQNSGDAMNCPFVIVLSDGKFNKNNVKPYLMEAREKKYLYLFVILDQVNPSSKDQNQEQKKSAQKSDGSILSMKSVEKNEETGAIKLVPYLKDFPFDYYCIVRDIQQLPTALGSILVQWFSLMSGAGGNNGQGSNEGEYGAFYTDEDQEQHFSLRERLLSSPQINSGMNQTDISEDDNVRDVYFTGKHTEENCSPAQCKEEDNNCATAETINQNMNFKKENRKTETNFKNLSQQRQSSILDWMNLLQRRQEIQEKSDEWSDASGEEVMAYKEKLFIAKNNIKLNIFLNLFLVASLGVIFSLDWFCYRSTLNDHSDVCFKILTTKVGFKWTTIRSYVAQGCPNLPFSIETKAQECLLLLRLYNCFIIYVALKCVAVLLSIHSMISSYHLIKSDNLFLHSHNSHGLSTNYNTFAQLPSHELEALVPLMTETSTFQYLSKRIPEYLTTTSMTWAILCNFTAIAQWLILTDAFQNFQYIEISPILDIVYCFALLILRLHQNNWETKLQIVRDMKQYLYQ